MWVLTSMSNGHSSWSWANLFWRICQLEPICHLSNPSLLIFTAELNACSASFALCTQVSFALCTQVSFRPSIFLCPSPFLLSLCLHMISFRGLKPKVTFHRFTILHSIYFLMLLICYRPLFSWSPVSFFIITITALFLTKICVPFYIMLVRFMFLLSFIYLHYGKQLFYYNYWSGMFYKLLVHLIVFIIFTLAVTVWPKTIYNPSRLTSLFCIHH